MRIYRAVGHRAIGLMALGLASLVLVACDNGDNGDNGGAGDSDATSTPTASPTTAPTASPTSTPDRTQGSDNPGTSTPAPGGSPMPVEPNGGPGTGGKVDPGYETEVVLAPIESVDIVVRESFPPQYAAVIVSGLPSGCAQFEGIDVERTGTTFDITVQNRMPAPGVEVACTMIYGMIENTVELGSDLVSGTEYTVVVNGEVEETFVAQ